MKETATICSATQPIAPSEPPSPRPSPDLSALLLEQLPVGVFQKDREGRYIFVNAWFCQFRKATPDRFLGKTAHEVAASKWVAENPEPAEKLSKNRLLMEGANHHQQIMQNGRPIESEESYTDEGGQEHFLHAIKGPVFSMDGTIIGTQGILLDITERKRAEAQLSNERNLLEALLNSSSDSIYFKDRQSRFVRCSEAMAPLFNLGSPDELIGKRDSDFCMEDHARAAYEDEQQIIRTGRPLIGKSERETWPDGRVTWALTSKMPLYDSRGEIIGTFGISKNITAIKEAELKVEELHKQLLQTSRQAGMAEVATSVLHNVGNVLNSANVSASLLLDNAKKSSVSFLAKAAALLHEHAGDLGAYLAGDEKGRQLPVYLARLSEKLAQEQQWAVEELESLRQHIEHIKEIVAMQQSYAKVSGVAEIVRAADLVEDALRMNAGAMVRHEIQLVRQYAPLPPMTVEKHKVLQILVNLIRNAKYACDESGRRDKSVRLGISQRARGVRIEIADNGVGIPPENLTRIFNHGFTTRKEGHGFGLHSGALAAKELGGTLTAYSGGPGQGATFILDLPAQPPKGGQ